MNKCSDQIVREGNIMIKCRLADRARIVITVDYIQ